MVRPVHALLVLAVTTFGDVAWACSDYEDVLASQEVRLSFTRDGEHVWLFAREHGWVRVGRGGASAPLQVRTRHSRVAADGSSIVVVREGTFRPSCEFDWLRFDRLDLEERTRSGTPRLYDVGDVNALAISPSGRRAATRSYDGWLWLDVESRRVGGRFEVDGRSLVWLSEEQVAILDGEGGLTVADVGSGAVLGRVEIATGEARLSLLADDASPAGCSLIDAEAEGDGWSLLRVGLGEQPYTVTRAPWRGRGAFLGIAASGERVVALDQRRVLVRERDSGEVVARLSGAGFYVAGALSPDGQRVAVASRAGGNAGREREEGVEYWEDESQPRGPLTLEVVALDDTSRQHWGGSALSDLETGGAP